MRSFIPSLLLAALVSTAAGIPFNIPFSIKRDAAAAPFPFDDLKAHKEAVGTGTAAHHHHHHHPTGTSGASATLAARQFSGTGAPFPTGTGGFPHPSGFGGQHDFIKAHNHTQSGTGVFPAPTGGIHNVKRFPSGPSGGFPSLSIPVGTGVSGGAFPTGTGGFGGQHAGKVQGLGHGFAAGTGFPTGTGGYPKPTGTGGFSGPVRGAFARP